MFMGLARLTSRRRHSGTVQYSAVCARYLLRVISQPYSSLDRLALVRHSTARPERFPRCKSGRQGNYSPQLVIFCVQSRGADKTAKCHFNTKLDVTAREEQENDCVAERKQPARRMTMQGERSEARAVVANRIMFL